ncbi:hypothetical protein [Anaerosacchariphilus polymeriproducens]|uniref:Uncharacterized protein n=1 Tax=Anaerosacchariphilus polymeriproducens TaxID=1812858 RepID=A0A371AQF6_9FIRM|nr:hypothetical protein [Anaerosacchariphilus polymeriproducens]RDU21808.1 hypothetical protein DWV06_17640 [Anaerosacchariphilus polymeriproducens]
MSITIKANKNSIIAPEFSKNKEGLGTSKSIDARRLNMGSDVNNQINRKRVNARKQAMQLISEAWGRDEKAVANLDNMSTQKSQMYEEIRNLISKIKDIDDTKKVLRQEYGVTADAQEQKDLELIEKYQNNKNGSSFDSFSEEEISRLKELQDTPLTKYQRAVLEVNNTKGTLNKEISKRQNEIIGLTKSITDAKLEQLKSNDMLKASDAADEIVTATEKEIFGMLMQVGKDAIDEKVEGEREKAEKTYEKREEEEERIEDARERRKVQKELIDGAVEADRLENGVSLKRQSNTQVAEAQKNIQKILKDNNMVNEDIKGIEIDLNF